MSTGSDMTVAARREAYNKKVAESCLVPLWDQFGSLAPPIPTTSARPACWHFASLRAHLLDAGALLSAEEAERRVLLLENPGMRGRSRVADSLQAGVQMLLPGESAGTHRHMAAALRLILEGSGAYTAVNGERTIMKRGDFIVTPSWTWHSHGNETSESIIWMDGLDVPIVNLFNTSFFERSETFDTTRPTGDSSLRYGHGGMVATKDTSDRQATPLINYRYEEARSILEDLHRQGTTDACHGVRLRYINPLTGGSPMPTMSAALQLIPSGFQTAPYLTTESQVFAVLEGRGRTFFEGQSLEWTQNDIFVVPSWTSHRLLGESEAILFNFSDRPAQEKLGIWRDRKME